MFLFVNNKKCGIQNIKNSSIVQEGIKTSHAEIFHFEVKTKCVQAEL